MQIGAGARIKTAREKKELTLEDLAIKLDIPVKELEAIEDGKDIHILQWKIVTAMRLAVILDLYLYEIIGEQALNDEEIALLLSAITNLSETHPGLKMDANFIKLLRKLYKMGTGREIG